MIRVSIAKISLSLVTLLLSITSLASVLKIEAGSENIKGIPVAKSGILTANKTEHKLGLVGAGVRKKFLFSVYVAQLLASDADRFVRSEDKASQSLDLSASVAMQLSFIYGPGVSAEEVQKAFRDALMKNDVNLDEPAIAKFLLAVKQGGDAANNTTLVVAGQKLQDGSELIVYEDTKGTSTVIPAPKGTSEKIMKIWLGEPADSGLGALRDSIINYGK